MTQPSLTTTFDTSLIDLATLSRSQRRQLQQQHRHQQPNHATSSFNTGSFSTTEPDTEDDNNPEDADDFANDAPSQAVNASFSTSFAAGEEAEDSSSKDESSSDEDGESAAAPPPQSSTQPPNSSTRLPPPPATVPPVSSGQQHPSQSTPRAPRSSRTKRPSANPSARHTRRRSSHQPSPSSSFSSSSSSSCPSSHSPHSTRPRPKRRKMTHHSPSPPASRSPPPAASSAPAPHSSAKDPIDERAAGKTGGATPVRHMDNVATYDAWAAVYDDDGNVLQGVDDLELEGLLPAFLGRAVEEAEKAAAAAATGKEGKEGEQRVFRVLDLGCGTGRNTAKVVKWGVGRGKGKGKDGVEVGVEVEVEVVGVDASKGMLAKAKEKLGPLLEDATNTTLTLLNHDPFAPARSLPPPLAHPFHAVLSTLVLEHLPLDTFFRALAALLAPGGFALVTNMHPQMGGVSQAGFVGKDEEGRAIKVRGKSWAHGIGEAVEAARAEGLEIVADAVGEGGGEGADGVEGVRERGIDEALIRSGKVGERGWKWVGVKVWFGFVVRKVGRGSGE